MCKCGSRKGKKQGLFSTLGSLGLTVGNGVPLEDHKLRSQISFLFWKSCSGYITDGLNVIIK